MSSEQNRNEPAFIAAHAGITVPAERLPLLAAAIVVAGQTGVALSRYDYGATEMASRFQPPASR